jgi:hypothetical protein
MEVLVLVLVVGVGADVGVGVGVGVGVEVVRDGIRVRVYVNSYPCIIDLYIAEEN